MIQKDPLTNGRSHITRQGQGASWLLTPARDPMLPGPNMEPEEAQRDQVRNISRSLSPRTIACIVSGTRNHRILGTGAPAVVWLSGWYVIAGIGLILRVFRSGCVGQEGKEGYGSWPKLDAVPKLGMTIYKGPVLQSEHCLSHKLGTRMLVM